MYEEFQFGLTFAPLSVEVALPEVSAVLKPPPSPPVPPSENSSVGLDPTFPASARPSLPPLALPVGSASPPAVCPAPSPRCGDPDTASPPGFVRKLPSLRPAVAPVAEAAGLTARGSWGLDGFGAGAAMRCSMASRYIRTCVQREAALR